MRYSARLIDHFMNPRNGGMMREPDGVGEDEDSTCGDLARFFLRAEGGMVRDARFQAYGCGPTIAAASAATELAAGRPIGEVLRVKAEDVEAALDGLPDDRKHAAEVAAGALRAAALACLRGEGPSGVDPRGDGGARV